MTDWRRDPLNLEHDPTRPTTRQILHNLTDPWAWITLTHWTMIDASMRVARVLDGFVDRVRNGDDQR